MQTLSCPIPAEINPLQNNGFMFNIEKLPEVRFFCQEVVIPELMLPMSEVSSPLVIARMPGDKPQYGDLQVNFLIDENMNNYVAVHNWIVGLGFPESWNQYSDFVQSNLSPLATNEMAAAVSDGVLQILNAQNKPIRTLRFIDLFPTSISSLTLQSTQSDTTYLMGSATFGYTYYKFE